MAVPYQATPVFHISYVQAHEDILILKTHEKYN